GKLARRIVKELDLDVEGVTRHQLYIHPTIRYTKRNSCNVIMARAGLEIRDAVKHIVLERFQEGSDPGLAVGSIIPKSVQRFGQMAQGRVLTKEDAIRMANETGIYLEELGGTGDGIIGALAGLGLCSTGADGRYVLLEGLRELQGSVSVERLSEMDINIIVLDSGKKVQEGTVMTAERIRPSRVAGKPMLFVKEGEDVYYPVVL
ncbi:MAG: ABC transporter substrate-binding protein, partial [Thermoplasmata archaeon]